LRGRPRDPAHRVLTIREEKFVALAARYGNRTRAFLEAGYTSRYPRQDAHKLATKPYIRAAISDAVETEIGAVSGLQSRLLAFADARIEQFEAWLSGRKSLSKLAAEGVDVRAVRSAKVSRDGRKVLRRLELYNGLEAVRCLAQLGGYAKMTEEPLPPAVTVNVSLGGLLAETMAAAAARPPAPGLAAPRFAAPAIA
jgi:hypothetical protein